MLILAPYPFCFNYIVKLIQFLWIVFDSRALLSQHDSFILVSIWVYSFRMISIWVHSCIMVSPLSCTLVINTTCNQRNVKLIWLLLRPPLKISHPWKSIMTNLYFCGSKTSHNTTSNKFIYTVYIYIYIYIFH